MTWQQEIDIAVDQERQRADDAERRLFEAKDRADEIQKQADAEKARADKYEKMLRDLGKL
jgi:predicted  nucleic acid-binding Zn-ribbon protein